MLRRDLVIYAGWAQDEAQEFIKQRGYTKYDVRLVVRAGQILIITRRDLHV